MTSEQPALPLGLLAVTMVGSLITALGIIGLFLPDEFPALSSPSVAWSLIAVGVAVDAYGVFGIVLRSMNR